jgi:hypothetical protein
MTFSRSWRTLAVPAVALGLLACGTAASDPSGTVQQASTALAHTIIPVPQGIVSGRYPGYPVPVYNNGPIMTGDIAIIPIFYGTAWQTNYQSRMMTFLSSMSNTSYWQVVQEYSDFATGRQPGSVSVAPQTNIASYPFGKNLSSANVQQIVQTVILQSPSPPSTQSIYMVFSADDVAESDGQGDGPCTQGGWHNQATFTWNSPAPTTISVTTQFAIVASAQYCLDTGLWTMAQLGDWGSTGPMGPAASVAVSVAFHEAAEAVTDPDTRTGWQPEIGDICAWIPGPVTATESGATFDLGDGAPYTSGQNGFASNQGPLTLVQTIWDPSQVGCAYGPKDLDTLTRAAACGNAKCGIVSDGDGEFISCGTCATGQTCTNHQCKGKGCTTPLTCCAEGGGSWVNGHCI